MQKSKIYACIDPVTTISGAHVPQIRRNSKAGIVQPHRIHYQLAWSNDTVALKLFISTPFVVVIIGFDFNTPVAGN
tara:strand:- start:39384 stop:39611 length:228 start_codon:yes stop_codon:yes gene_type:complete